MSRPLERLINLLAYLVDSPSPVTSEQVRQTIPGYDDLSDSAFHKKFERDKASVRKLGFNLTLAPTDIWKVEFGYVIPDENFLSIDLTEEERSALALAVHMVRSGGWPAGAMPLLKLGGARVADPNLPVGYSLGLDSDYPALIFQAILERRVLSFSYRGHDRELCPYAMRHLRGNWYFAGAEPGEPNQVRTYRMDRAEGFKLHTKQQAFKPPKGYRAQDVLSSMPWEDPVARQALIRCHTRLAWWVKDRFPGTTAVKYGSDPDWTTLEVPYTNSGLLLDRLIDLDDMAVILEPADLRAEMIDRLKALVV
ncbi:MAG: WYL domain-containing protein [bacterium]|nr:WYL domain-containing protein [bacterium]